MGIKAGLRGTQSSSKVWERSSKLIWPCTLDQGVTLHKPGWHPKELQALVTCVQAHQGQQISCFTSSHSKSGCQGHRDFWYILRW